MRATEVRQTMVTACKMSLKNNESTCEMMPNPASTGNKREVIFKSTFLKKQYISFDINNKIWQLYYYKSVIKIIPRCMFISKRQRKIHTLEMRGI